MLVGDGLVDDGKVDDGMVCDGMVCDGMVDDGLVGTGRLADAVMTSRGPAEDPTDSSVSCNAADPVAAESFLIHRVSGRGTFDRHETRKILAARKITRKSLPHSPRLSNKERKRRIQKMKELYAWCNTKSGTADHTKKEKEICVNVFKFVEAERRRYKDVTGREDVYVKEKIDEVGGRALFKHILKRTSLMTGVNWRTLQRFIRQSKASQLNPKRKPGRMTFTPPEWIFSAIRVIITG